MRSTSLVLLAFTGPILAGPQGAPLKGAAYTLQIKSSAEPLNNKILSTKGGKVGIFPGGLGLKVSSSAYASSNTLSLHPGAEDHQLALVGSKGLLELVDVVNPRAESIPHGQSMEWSTFVIDGQGNVGVKDGADIPSRRWVAFTNADGSHGIGLYDGFTVPPPKQFQNVTLVATRT
ncbi:hypothetical protein FKW77_000618 [Venturia effusa]|uniref:Uncharacterized protein n=1 Tax=Venturia effusa TaxID=50376 RepID=A0A517LM29_9PEZI|nr:hypothetical protein FKW77_000618 [Venturia effusa]